MFANVCQVLQSAPSWQELPTDRILPHLISSMSPNVRQCPSNFTPSALVARSAHRPASLGIPNRQCPKMSANVPQISLPSAQLPHVMICQEMSGQEIPPLPLHSASSAPSAVNLMALREHSSPRRLATRHDRNVECATTNVTIFGEHPCFSSRLKAERVPARPPRPLGSRNVSSPWAFAASECASPARPPSDPT